MLYISLLVCSITCILLCWIIINISKYLAIFQKIPSNRCIHCTPTPQIGGVAILCSILISDLLTRGYGIFVYNNYFQNQIIWLLVLLVFFIGFLDDLIDLPALSKLFFQFICSISVASLGYIIEFDFLPYSINFLITVAWILWVTNSINLMDGMDGLAAGVVGIILTSFVFLSFDANINNISLLFFIFAIVGFMFFNGHPAKIFMGDCGSLFLGFSTAFFSIKVIEEHSNKIGIFILVFLALAVPTIDILLVIYFRWKAGKPIMSADKRHIHHRIFEKTKSQRNSVSYIYILVSFFCVASVCFDFFWNFS